MNAVEVTRLSWSPPADLFFCRPKPLFQHKGHDYHGGVMTFADSVCECCGHSDHPAGVASSGIGAFSIFWCGVCVAVGAEPSWAVDTVAGDPEERAAARAKGLEVPRLIYYSSTDDSYHFTEDEEVVPVSVKDGTECKTRTEAGAHLTTIKENLSAQNNT